MTGGPLIKHFSLYISLIVNAGKRSEEYQMIKRNISIITETIRHVPSASGALYLKYVEKDWVASALIVTENELVNIALCRIEQDKNEFLVFTDMLHRIGGMDILLKHLSLTGELSILF